MKPAGSVLYPCDQGVIASSPALAPCSAQAASWVLAATILGSSLAFIDGTVVNVALPALQASLNATVVDMQWVVEAYALLLAALLLVGGSLGDTYGRRRIYVIGIIVFATASVGCSLALSVNQLIFSRAVQGIGAALLVPGSLAILSASFRERDRGRAIGTWSAFTAMTTAVGPVLGGWLIEHGSWRWVFFINQPIAAIAIMLTLWHVPESRNPLADGKPDWPGAALAVVGLTGIAFALIESSNRSGSDPVVIVALLMGVCALIAFAAVESRTKAPLLPMNLLRVRNFAGTNLLTLFLYGALGGMFFFFPMNLIQVQGYLPTAAGSASLPFVALIFLLSRWTGGLMDRYGSRRLLIFGPIVAAIGFGLFAVPSIGGNYWITFFPAVMTLGLGMAISVAPLTTTVMNSVGGEWAGVASGINNAVARLAGVLAIAIFGIVMLQTFDRHLMRNLAEINISPEIRRDIGAQRIKLAAIEVPSNIDITTRRAIERLIDESFIAGFRGVMLIASGLAFASAATAWFVIRDKP
jgi:EmrB/QacA subfamily drug resistance transporter